jgi:4-hydroxy-2-oxoheptanedioate aldolase
MRASRVLREIREGKFASCLKISIPHPVVIELAGLAGASAVWLCNEHIPTNWETTTHCIRAAKIHDMDVIVRVSKGSYSEYIKVFEADASGIMIPHVASAAEVRQIVEMCRFHPLGRRALDGGNDDGAYCQIPMAEYLRQSNQEKYLIAQIESPEAVEQIEEIAAVEGYEFLLFGPGDYAHRIGRAGEIHHPEVLEARRRVEEAAGRHGKYLFGVAAGGSAAEQFARGYVIANVGGDVVSLGNAFRDAVSRNHLPVVSSLYQQP